MKDRVINSIFLIALLAAMGLLVTRSFMMSGPLVTPAIFASHLTFEEGAAQAISEGKPLIVIGSAEWCRPCKQYMNEALSDEAVQAWIREQAVAVHLDVDVDRDITASLRITSMPTTIVMRNGGELARRSGAMSASDLLEWLQKTSQE